MKILFFILTLTSTVFSDSIYRNTDWNIEVDLSGTNFSIDTYMDQDSLLKSGFCKFTLPKMNCKTEHVVFEPEVRILDKYIDQNEVEYGQILDTLHEYLSERYEILSYMMRPDDFGHLYGFVIQKGERYFCFYHLIEVDNKKLLIECIGILGTRREIYIELAKLIRGVRVLKN